VYVYIKKFKAELSLSIYFSVTHISSSTNPMYYYRDFILFCRTLKIKHRFLFPKFLSDITPKFIITDL
jgi:hypothetical protein